MRFNLKIGFLWGLNLKIKRLILVMVSVLFLFGISSSAYADVYSVDCYFTVLAQDFIDQENCFASYVTLCKAKMLFLDDVIKLVRDLEHDAFHYDG